MTIELILNDVKNEFYDTDCEIGAGVADIVLSFYIDKEKTFEKQLKNKDIIKKAIYEQRNFAEDFDYDGKMIEKLDYIEKNIDNLFDIAEYITLNFEQMDDLEFIRNNPKLLSKKIVINEEIYIEDTVKLKEIKEKYKEFADNIYLMLTGNLDYVSLKDSTRTIDDIEDRAMNIKRLGLSPMETIMYVYDKVRNRVYTSETEDEKSFKSRDLTEVLFGDKIVCAGYAVVFNTILTELGIKNYVVHLDDINDQDGGHARNVIYIKDDKYGIDGTYYFDATWDSKRKNETNEYLQRYEYFAKTKKEIDEIDKRMDLVENNFSNFSLNMLKKIKMAFAKNDLTILGKYGKSMNTMSFYVNGCKIVPFYATIDHAPSIFRENIDKEDVLNKFEYVFSKYIEEIPAETMIQVLNNVRRVEYLEDPEHYPYSVEDLYRIYRYAGWEFKDLHISEENKNINSSREVLGEMTPREQFINFANEIGLYEDVKQTKGNDPIKRILKKNN